MNVGNARFPMSYKSRPDFQLEKDCLLVVGCADCVWDDIKAAPVKDKDVLAISDIGIYFPGDLTHWVTCHPNIIAGGRLIRDQRKDHQDFLVHIPDYAVPKVGDYVWTIPKLAGTSGMFGILVGIGLGYKKIILAGVPLTRSGHFWNPTIQIGFDKKGIRLSWEKTSEQVFEDRVRSLSGWTKELLGEPTEEWLNV